MLILLNILLLCFGFDGLAVLLEKLDVGMLELTPRFFV